MLQTIASIFVLHHPRAWLLPDLQNMAVPCPEGQGFLCSELHILTHSSTKPAYLQGVLVISFAAHTCLLSRAGWGCCPPQQSSLHRVSQARGCREAPVSSSSAPSTATAEPSHGAGTTSVTAHSGKTKMPSQVFLDVAKLCPKPSLGCSCAGGRWCLKIINTDDTFALTAIQFPASFGFLC